MAYGMYSCTSKSTLVPPDWGSPLNSDMIVAALPLVLVTRSAISFSRSFVGPIMLTADVVQISFKLVASGLNATRHCPRDAKTSTDFAVGEARYVRTLISTPIHALRDNGFEC